MCSHMCEYVCSRVWKGYTGLNFRRVFDWKFNFLNQSAVLLTNSSNEFFFNHYPRLKGNSLWYFFPSLFFCVGSFAFLG